MRSDGLLFAHILSAMILVGGVLTVVVVPQAAQHRAWPAQVPILRALAAVTALFVGFAITDIDLIVGGVILTLVQVLGASPHPRRQAGRVASVARDRATVARPRGPRGRDRFDGREARRLRLSRSRRRPGLGRP
jgi:hypothetical protein